MPSYISIGKSLFGAKPPYKNFYDAKGLNIFFPLFSVICGCFGRSLLSGFSNIGGFVLLNPKVWMSIIAFDAYQLFHPKQCGATSSFLKPVSRRY